MLDPDAADVVIGEPSQTEAPRMRPRVHFTAARGWTNDPHGLVHFGGKYHMFFQYNPGGVVWDKACHWGHATSDDLIEWSEHDVALAPFNEVGCWSGSAVVTGDEVTILYTTIRHDDFSRGAVAIARSSGNLMRWDRHDGPDVIAGPPNGLAVQGFRDPFVWKSGSEWRALLGAGVPGVGGTALQYSSPDLLEWSFDGPIAQGSAAATEPVWTGSVWECPQLFEVDGHWVLLVSAWDNDVVHHVAYAIGSYDGRHFTAERWGRLTHGPIAYATSFFRDSAGMPCVISWLREEGNVAPPNSPWASAVSLPFLLGIVDGDLQLQHHDNLRRVLSQRLVLDAGPRSVSASTFLVTVSGDLLGACLKVGSETGAFIVSVDSSGLVVRHADGTEVLRLPRARHLPTEELEVSVDADILELTWTGCPGVGSARIGEATRYVVSIARDGGNVRAVLHTSA